MAEGPQEKRWEHVNELTSEKKQLKAQCLSGLESLSRNQREWSSAVEVWISKR